MRIASGLYNNHGYVQIRVFPYNNRTPYTEKGFGCWCEQHIKEAERRLRSLRDEIESGKFVKQQGERQLKFTEVWDIFYRIHYLENKERSKKSIANVGYLGTEFKALWPDMLHNEFTPQHVREEFVNKTSVKPSTLKYRLGVLKSYFERIEEWVKLKQIDAIKLPEFNPVMSALIPKNTKFVGRKHLEIGEIKRFKDWCIENDPDLWVAAYTAATTLLRHKDLDGIAGQLSIQGIAGKTGKVFNLPGSAPLAAKISGFQKRWQKARDAAGIGWFHWHWWRAQGAKLMRLQGVSEETVKEILQHSSVQMTREYTGDPEWARPAVDSVKAFLDNL